MPRLRYEEDKLFHKAWMHKEVVFSRAKSLANYCPEYLLVIVQNKVVEITRKY